MDQRRAKKPTRQKEQQLHMSLFTFILDLSALQAFALHQVIDDGSNVLDFVSFKRAICENLVVSHRSQRKKHHAAVEEASIDRVIGSVRILMDIFSLKTPTKPVFVVIFAKCVG